MSKAGVVVTNPPFSLAKILVPMLDSMGLKYLLILPFLVLSYSMVFPLTKAGRIRVGYNDIQFFERPGKSPKKFGNIRWLTNLPVTGKPPLPLTATYSPQKYPKMYRNLSRTPNVNLVPTNIISVDTLADIPRDYKGPMAVPVTILEKNHSQFELLDVVSNGYVKGRVFRGKPQEGLAKRIIIQRH